MNSKDTEGAILFATLPAPLQHRKAKQYLVCYVSDRQGF